MYLGFGTILVGLLFSTSVMAEDLRIVELRTVAEIDAHYCTVTTGTVQSLLSTPCFTPNHYPLDLIYIPSTVGDKILKHVGAARKNGYYHELSRTDFFHGHPLRKSSTPTYESPQQYFADIDAMLYHSEEYTQQWYDESVQGLSMLERTPRSFMGWFGAHVDQVFPAIDFFPVTEIPKQYNTAGTIYSEQLIAALKKENVTDYQQLDPASIKTCATCKPCKVLDQIWILQDPNGRFTTADNLKVEMFIHCRYYPN